MRINVTFYKPPQKRIFVIMGPSGSGKTTIVNHLINQGATLRKEVAELVSTTTRAMRPGEVDGKTYYFVDEKTFKATPMAEATCYDGTALRGLSRKEIESKLDKYDTVLFIADINGVQQMRKQYPNETRVIFLESSPDTMRAHMKERGDGDADVERRVSFALASGELNNGLYADHVVPEGNLLDVCSRIDKIVFTEETADTADKEIS